VKERLVGAAVLMAAAVILIPEMLSGPRREANAPATARNGSDAGVKTYTIDLSRSPGAENGPTITAAAPPPETSASAGASTGDSRWSQERPPPEVKPPEADEPAAAPTEMPVGGHQSTPETTRAPAPTPIPETLPPPPDRSPSSASSGAQERPAPIASATAVPTSRGWAVQLGSFASRATADRMASDVTSQGHKAFVMPVKTGTSTLYRVRIGPFTDRGVANEVLRDVKSRVANAAVVAHP